MNTKGNAFLKEIGGKSDQRVKKPIEQGIRAL